MMLSNLLFIVTFFTLAWARQLIPQTSVNGSPQVVQEIRNRLAVQASEKREWTNSISLDSTFNDAVLFKIKVLSPIIRNPPPALNESILAYGGMQVTCKTCYTKGTATARMVLGSGNNVPDVLDAVEKRVKNTIDGLAQWFKDIEVDWSEMELDIPPPPDMGFNIGDIDFPEAKLELSLKGTEVYIDLQTLFTAGMSYRIRLFQNGLGLDMISPAHPESSLFAGLIFAVDLMVQVDGELKIEHGFHIKLDDIMLKLAMFSEEVADLQLNGGEFEFLPIAVDIGAGVGLKAILQVSVRAGFALVVDLLPGPDVDMGPINTDWFKGSVGLETRVHANLVDFASNITMFPDEKCDLRVENKFQFGVGAGAGAYLGIGEQTWGPRPKTATALFPHTFNHCLIGGDATATTTANVPAATTTAAPLIGARFPKVAEMKTKTMSKKVTYSGVECGITGVINCPASAETYKVHVVTETRITVVPTGVEPVWPETFTAGPPAKTRNFGTEKVVLTSTSGKPKATAV